MLTRKYEYWLLDPHGEDELPAGIVEYTFSRSQSGAIRYGAASYTTSP